MTRPETVPTLISRRCLTSEGYRTVLFNERGEVVAVLDEPAPKPRRER